MNYFRKEAKMRIKKEIYDISVPLQSNLVSWPGEEGFTRKEKRDGGITISTIHCGSHTGTHVDAPKHFIINGSSVDKLPLSSLVGECYVADINHNGPTITARDIFLIPLNIERVLFKTKNTERGLLSKMGFTTDYISLDKSAVQTLIKRGIKLVGVDYLSVEAKKSPGYPVHKTLLNAGIIIIEGCSMKDIKPGKYELIALPLRIKGGDGSPARVILRKTS